MPLKKTLISCALSPLVLALALAGCGTAGSDACQQAATKIQSCQRAMDCSAFTDAADQADCLKIKADAQTAISSPSSVCTGDVQTRADAINKCTLDPTRMCTECTDATIDSSAAPPANGAKLFAWNSCYSNNDSFDSDYQLDGCFEQWGSYPAACGKLSGRVSAAGKRCRSVCNTTTCPKGCFSNYGAGNSLKYLASWYACK